MRQFNSNTLFLFLSTWLSFINFLKASELDSLRFPYTRKGLWLIKFYNGACENCQKYETTWHVLKENLQDWSYKNQFHFGQVDCSKNKFLCRGLEIDSTPSIYLLSDGVERNECFYKGDLKDLLHCLAAYRKAFNLSSVFLDNSDNFIPNLENKISNFEAQEQRYFQEAESLEEEPEENDINVSGSVIILNQDNYSLTENGPWFVKYYAPWCGHCKKLEPTWETLGEKMKGIVNVGKVDCTVNEEICKKMKIRGYPTLKLLQSEKTLDYWGARSLESLSQFAQDRFGKKPRTPVNDIIEKMTQDDVGLVYYSPSSKSMNKTVFNALNDLDIKIPVYEVKQYWMNRAAYNIMRSPSLLLFKNGKVQEYLGSLYEPSEILDWILREQYPVVRIVSIKDVIDSFGKEDGLVVLKLIVDSPMEERKKFRDIAEPVLRRESFDMLFGVLDATQAKVLQLFGIKEGNLPAIVIYDIKNKLQYSKNKNGDLIALNYNSIRQAIQSFKKGELEGIALDTSKKLFTSENFKNIFIYLLLPIIVVIGLIFYLANYVFEDEEEKESEEPSE